MWNASHLAVRLCALRHWKRVSMPPTTQSLRHPLTRAIHIAPRIKTARLRRKTPNDKMVSCKEVVQISQTILHGRDFRAVGNGKLWLTPCKLACERSLETGPNIVASVEDGRSWSHQ